MGHATLLVPDGLSFKVLVEVRATMRVKMLILHKSDFDYLLTFYPPPMERLRDELTDWAEVLRWISLPKVYAKKIRRIAQMNSGNVDTGAGGGGAGDRRGSNQKNRLASIVLNSAGRIPPPLRRGSTKKALNSARGKGGGDFGGEADRRKGSLNRGRGSQERREKEAGRSRSSSKELRADKNIVGGGGGGGGGVGASPREATPAPAVREGLLRMEQLPESRSS